MSNEPPNNFLDAILNDVIGITTPFQRKQARAELAHLRAAASEADALRAERDELKRNMEELELSAENGTAIMRKNTELLATVAEQARQIEAARHAMQWIYERYTGLVESGDCGSWDVYAEPCVIECEQWLAANAPTPAPEAERTAPVVRYCEHCQRDTVTIDGACLWCNHVKPTPEAEQERTA